MIRNSTAEVVSELSWFRSSHSSGPDGDTCVEVANTPGLIHVRDSKHTDGPRLALTREAWSAFVPFASED
ncbi:DUF397 domain-containing protein [Streptomyces sediminimaris]|uniref:DUF397 domain-containing protein n=1 Tax=Streptomyces sediminimaris TaxID=3383721 RepID=UPI00399B8ED9